MSEIPYKTYLSEDELPQAWYNLRSDMKTKPAPLLNPQTLRPCTAEELGAVFCEELVRQELDETTPEIPIPQPIRDFYKMYRPSPLVRAYFLEKALDTPAHIYYKFEGNNTSGSHKLNSAIAHHRDRSRTVGHRTLHGLRLLRTRLPGLHGQVLLRAEALPPRGHAHLRRLRHPLPLRDH